MLPESQSAIDRFIDALWLEDGLSANTLAAYRRDLSLLAHWLREQGVALDQSTESHLQQYFAVKHAATKPTCTATVRSNTTVRKNTANRVRR
jgi:integrase/recombinase XerD